MHFLRYCVGSEPTIFRKEHEARPPYNYRTLDPTTQAAYLLGCAVEDLEAPGEGDGVHEDLVGKLWAHGCASLTNPQGPSEAPPVQQNNNYNLCKNPKNNPVIAQHSQLQKQSQRSILEFVCRYPKAHPSVTKNGVEAHGMNAKPS